MKKLLFAFALMIAFASPVAAYHFQKDMVAIDAVLPSASLSKDDMAKVKRLRAKGEKLHKLGDHAQSVKVLRQAKKMLGVK